MVLELLSVAAVGFLFNRKSPTVDTRLFDPSYHRIRCPICLWQPGKDDRWVCDPGCGQIWNTFETSGVCPGCTKSWEHTACLRCGAWSPHAEWYEQGE